MDSDFLFAVPALVRRAIVFSSVVIMLFGSSAAADPIVITITSGTAHIERTAEGPPHHAGVSLVGTGDFSVTGGGNANFGSCDPCLAGTAVSDRGHISLGIYGSGTVQYQGDQFPFYFFTEPFGGGELSFSGSQFTLPDSASAPLVFRSSFILLPSLIHVEDHRIEGETRFLQFLLSGQGTATLRYGTSEPMFGKPSYRPVVTDFEFSPAPVPEPATVLLIGLGLGIVRLRQRMSSRAATP